ncbi:hypothetical protein ACQP00_39980 [Dactylosporangium sp. CS-047395]|uniref:hypothetical protein n=1 Tax=Dactylosporangium sp. CS-047395 TaxID=3239936 RepID=UPI003D92293C
MEHDEQPDEPVGDPVEDLSRTPLGEMPIELADYLVRWVERRSDDDTALHIARFGSSI